VVVIAAAVLRRGASPPRPASPAVEKRLKAESKKLIRVPYRLTEQAGAISVSFGPETLRTHELYLRPASPETGDAVFIDSEGKVVRGTERVATLSGSGELLVSRSDVSLFVDGKPAATNLAGYDVLWASLHETKPKTAVTLYPRVAFTDSFMRRRLENDYWRVSGGNWGLNQHGGGMPTSEYEAHSSEVERAVNPFTVIGAGSGMLTCGKNDWFNYHAQARFYFGVPKTGKIVDKQTVPTGTDMMILQGREGGQQVAFGWQGSSRTFVLLSRSGDGPWRELSRWNGKRPPVTNWIKLGLAVAAGVRAEAYLDDRPILQANLTDTVSGPFHVMCGHEMIELDDVEAWSLPRPESTKGTPYFLQSKSFASKRDKKNSDPEEFDQWARATDAFVRNATASGDSRFAEIITSKPLMGDFFYESLPHSDEHGSLPEGDYRFTFYRKDPNDPFSMNQLKPAFSFEAVRKDDEWTVPGVKDPGTGKPVRCFTLRFARRAADGDRLTMSIGDVYHPCSEPLPGPLHASVIRVHSRGTWARYPSPNHHMFYCANLVNELFEQAPTDWSWIDGAFRMDMRWACQDQWNFMACGSTDVPFMVSKRTFGGDQEHDFFMSLRPMLPWDAGDTTFDYSPQNDPGFKILASHGSWYNRHNLNFSFCMNGRDPMSGYALVFGGHDNSRTMLLRKGKVIHQRADKLFSRQESHHAVHWSWWNFHVRKYGNRIRVTLNDDLLFDFTDPEPLEGGHIGFWTVRNGFILARAVSTAADIQSEPDVLYVDQDEGSDWVPLLRDSVKITASKGAGRTRVEANVGAGSMGVRYTLEKPVDLAATPVLVLPMQIKDGTHVNLHIQTDRRSYLLQLNAPSARTKALLAPEFEKGECFLIAEMGAWELHSSRLLGEAQIRGGELRFDLGKAIDGLGKQPADRQIACLTVGNTSNEDYLLAGNGGNNTGASYELGTPTFVAR